MKKRLNFILVPMLILFSLSSFAAVRPTPGNSAAAKINTNNQSPAFIDVTNGIPSWVNNYDNNTQSGPQDKGAYVSSFDNSAQNGKIYYQTYTQSSTGVTIATVPKKTNNHKQINKQSNSVTYETSVK